LADKKSNTIRVRLPIPKKDALKKQAEWSAQQHIQSISTPQDSLIFYICARRKDIKSQEQEIAKSMKRIERLHMCIKIAEELIYELDNKTTSKDIEVE
jgi:hypothetical protein